MTVLATSLSSLQLGLMMAVAIPIHNIAVIALSGTLLARLMPEIAPVLIMEVPRYQIPSPDVVLKKTWLRAKEFVVIAWPLLIAGSVILSFLEYYKMDAVVN